MKFLISQGNTRIQNSIRNLIFGFGGQIFQYILSFATRTIFIYLLGTTYLGVNGLFTNILSVLSLAELGVGGSFQALLYKPLHDKDTEKLKSLMAAFKKTYTIIGAAVGILGLGMLPFLHVLINDNDIENIGLIYIMFLTGSVVTYFCAYRISLIITDQKAYICTIYSQAFIFIQYSLQIAILFITGNFILYLAVQILCGIGVNMSLSRKAGKMYPFLKEKASKLDLETRKDLLKKIYASIYHHTGHVVITGTDNIVISAFVGIYWVGLYSNYVMIIGILAAFSGLFFNAIVASVGNLTVSTEKDTNYFIFKRLQFMNFLITGFFSVGLFSLFNPFIKLWVGEKYLLNDNIVLLIVVSFYVGLDGIKRSVSIFKNTTGLFYYDRYSPVAEATINIILSILLVRRIGIAGVLLGTIIAAVFTNMWFEPYVVYKHLFEIPLKQYFKRYVIYGFVTFMTAFIVKKIVTGIYHDSWAGFLAMMASCILLTFSIFILLFHRTDEFKYFYDFAKRYISRMRDLLKRT